VPKSLDPVARGRKMPLPDARPSEKIAKLFPQVDPLKDQQKDQKNGAKPPEASVAAGAKDAANTPAAAKNAAPAAAPPSTAVAQASTSQTAAAKAVPLPEARPNIEPGRDGRRHRHHHHYRRGR
jgi:membrane-bound lytic murein transglycosylase A